MSRRAVLGAILGAAGLALYLWPALTAPVVLWSDSRIDMDWAREGAGILSPAPAPPSPHPAKPAYIAFLRAAMAGASPDEAVRRIVVVQSALLWLSIAGASVLLARRTTFSQGVALYLVLILFLRLRDTASAVMSEAPAAALLLPIAAALLEPPARARAGLGLGAASAVLFLIRPNAGAMAVALALLALGLTRRWRGLAAFAAAFALLVAPVWALTAPADGDGLRGLGPAFVWARADYGWTNAEGLAAPAPADARRQLVWRVFHGSLGIEFYDARWSATYAAIGEGARGLSPFLVLGAVALLAAPSRSPLRLARALGLALAAMLLAQSYVLGALPRLALTMLPALFLWAIAAWPPARAAAAAIFGVLLAGALWQRQVLDCEWGMIEASGIRLRQTIPRGALPEAAPATLHVRIAPALLPSDAELEVLGPSGETLYDSRSDGERRRPYVTAPLSAALLEANRRGPVVLELVSGGSYGPHQYLLFPIILRPWSAAARRDGGSALSPSTGIASGALDWWAHPGER